VPFQRARRMSTRVPSGRSGVASARWCDRHSSAICGAGEPYAEGRFPDATTDLLGDDPFAGWESAADDALSAFAEDDAMIRTVHLERGPTPAREYCEELIADLTVHTWDLARAIEGDTDLDGELVTAALVVAGRLPEDGLPGYYDPPLDTSPSATPQQRLLARFGRRPL